jgi:hypothetical protein
VSVTVAVQVVAWPIASGLGEQVKAVLVGSWAGWAGLVTMFRVGAFCSVIANSRLSSGVSATPSSASWLLPKLMVFSGVVVPGANMKTSLVGLALMS